MKPLYEISDEYQYLIKEIMECEEINDDTMLHLEKLHDSIEQKAINIASIIKNMEAEEEGIKNAIANMVERKNRISNKMNSLKEYLKCHLERCDIKKVSSPYFDISVKTNPVSVSVTDENLIPNDYFKEKIMRTLDKVLISQQLKSDIPVPGAFLERRTRIEIR